MVGAAFALKVQTLFAGQRSPLCISIWCMFPVHISVLASQPDIPTVTYQSDILSGILLAYWQPAFSEHWRLEVKNTGILVICLTYFLACDLAYILVFYLIYFVTFDLAYILEFYLAYLLTFLLPLYLTYLLAFFLASSQLFRVRQCPIWSLRLESGRTEEKDAEVD